MALRCWPDGSCDLASLGLTTVLGPKHEVQMCPDKLGPQGGLGGRGALHTAQVHVAPES